MFKVNLLESVETLILFCNEVQEQVLKCFLGNNPNSKNGNFLEETIMSISRLGVRVATLICYQLENGTYEGQHKKTCLDTNGRMVETGTMQFIRNVGESVKYWFEEAKEVEGDRPGSEERRKSAMGMFRTANKVWNLTSVTETLISVNENWFQKYVTDRPGIYEQLQLWTSSGMNGTLSC